jgi:hypothetical protein
MQTVIRSLRKFLSGDREDDRRRRSRSGLLLAVLMLPMLLGVMGCFELPAPIGNPEKSRIDPAMNGVWLAESGELEGLLMIFEPYDKRTWLVRWTILEKHYGEDEEIDLDEAGVIDGAEEPEADVAERAEPEAGEEADALPEEIVVTTDDRSPLQVLGDGDYHADGVALFKTWRTRISGKSFITMEFRVEIDSDDGMEPRVWWGARVWLTDDDQLAIHFIDKDFDDVKAASTRRELERAVRRHHDNEDLYGGDPILLTCVPLEYYDSIGDIVEAAGLASEYD